MAAIATGQAGPEAGSGFRDLLDTLVSFDKPLLAAVHGVGDGARVHPARPCGPGARWHGTARLRAPFAEMGVPPEAASSWLLPERLGWQRAAAVLLASEWIDADQAVAARPGPAGVRRGDGASRRPWPWPGHRLVPAARHPADQAADDGGAAPAIEAARAREEAAFAALFADPAHQPRRRG